MNRTLSFLCFIHIFFILNQLFGMNTILLSPDQLILIKIAHEKKLFIPDINKYEELPFKKISSQLYAMDKDLFTQDQQSFINSMQEKDILIQQIDNYQEFPFRATGKKIAFLHNEIARLFFNQPTITEKLKTQLLQIKIERHILELEKLKPIQKKCKKAVYFLAHQCYQEHFSKASRSSCYCINRIKELAVNLPHTITPGYDVFEQRTYKLLLILAHYNPCFTPTTYTKMTSYNYNNNRSTS